jgi:hypothetical protein
MAIRGGLNLRSPPIMADDEESVEHAERNRRDCEDVHRGDSSAMIAQKGEPAFPRLRISCRFAQPAGNGSLGDVKTQHQQLAMDARRIPGLILSHHPKDETSYLLRNPFSADHPAGFGDGTPNKRKSNLSLRTTTPSELQLRAATQCCNVMPYLYVASSRRRARKFTRGRPAGPTSTSSGASKTCSSNSRWYTAAGEPTRRQRPCCSNTT